MCYRLGIIGAIEQFLKVTYREVQLMLLHQTFAPFYHGDTTSCVQRVCMTENECYRLGIIGATEHFLQLTYREVPFVLLHKTFAPPRRAAP